MWALNLLVSGLFVLGALACKPEIDPSKQNIDWWKKSVIYQIYPRSFKDSNGDGIGDLNGITEKLEHIKDIGADALWLSPIYASPQKDFGYDISDFTDVAKEYGTLEDFDKLSAKAKKLGLKLMLDFVPNHSSDEHEWFQKSIKREKPYDEFYIWKDAKKDAQGKNIPPNNWLSVFGQSAWEWNEERKQYYYHAFVAGQPDLNYRNSQLKDEMKKVLSFWMKRGVDGFRVDAINYMFESEDLKDEPESGKDVPEDDYEFLDHVYTRDLNDTYGVVGTWSNLLDYHVRNWRTDGKALLLEAYTKLENSMKYYDVGANPFNFMFIGDITKTSTAIDYKRIIEAWLEAIPRNQVTNWVVGNHDNHRVATRFGENREDQISMLSAVLPGILVIYNGDEIGMTDRPFTWEETIDPAGCQAGEERYDQKSRDPERTPFQWDATTSAGFSTNATTWLPVNENYKTLNLAAQKKQTVSHYNVFKALTALKKMPVLLEGTHELVLHSSGEALAVIRKLAVNDQQEVVVLLINLSDEEIEVDVTEFDVEGDFPTSMHIYIGSAKSGLKTDDDIDVSAFKLPGAASVILKSGSKQT